MNELRKKCEKPLLQGEVFEYYFTVLQGILTQKFNLDFKEDNLISEIDPRKGIGLSIFYNNK